MPEPPPVNVEEPLQAGDPPPTSMAGEPPRDSPPAPAPEGVALREKEASGRGEEKGKRHSSRTQEPLPDIPEPGVGARSEEKVPAHEAPQGGEGEQGEEDGYAYACVSGEHKGLGESDSEEDEGKREVEMPLPGEAAEASSQLPPYGRVTTHKVAAPAGEDADSYAEVRKFDKTPHFQEGRFRSSTELQDPNSALEGRERSHTTESATSLPLPAIPGLQDNGQTVSAMPDGVSASRAPAAQPAPSRQPKERLYEAMDELEEDAPEDTYETVPDEIKPTQALEATSDHPQSPQILVSPSAVIAPPSPSVRLSGVPLPPSSPVPRKQDRRVSDGDKEKEEANGKHKKKKGEKKELAKTFSDSESRKRAFSFFGRLKQSGPSVGKMKEKETAHPMHGPLPDIPKEAASSPHHLVASLGPTFAPPEVPAEDRGDAMYDTPNVQQSEAEAKSKSLPAQMRSAGASVLHPPNLPLPELPEDSGSGVIVHEKLALADEDEAEPSYDVVVHGVRDEEEEEFDPQYDTVNREELLRVAQEVDPGYDKVGIQVGQEEGEAAKGREDEESVASPKDIGYGRVTKPSSAAEGERPEHDELGYAVIPAEVKMRKRTMSASAQRPTRPVDRGALEHHQQDPPQGADHVSSPPGNGRTAPLLEFHAPSSPPQAPEFVELEDPYSRIDSEARRLTAEGVVLTSPTPAAFHPYSKIDLGELGAQGGTDRGPALASPVALSPPQNDDDYDPYSKISGGEANGDIRESPAQLPLSNGVQDNPADYDPYSKIDNITGEDAGTDRQGDSRYSAVDMVAKGETHTRQDRPSSTSAADSVASSQPPPVPPQTAGIHELVPAPQAKPSSPPAAFSPSTITTDDEDRPYARVMKPLSSRQDSEGTVPGHNLVGVAATVGSEQPLKESEAVGGSLEHGSNTSARPAYVQHGGSLDEAPPPGEPMYDSLDPVSDTVDVSQPLYDSLAPASTDEPVDDTDEQGYDVIDERTRLALQQAHSQH